MTFGLQAAATYAGLTKVNGNLLVTSAVISLNARIPIEGWQQSNIIIGSFNGLESCTSTLECTDTFSAKVSSAGVVSDENVDWINGNASLTDTSLYALTLKTSIVAVPMNCTVATTAPSGLDNYVFNITANTSATVTIRTGYAAGGGPSLTKNAYSFNIICQKQGVDYVGKTAKAVASDQNVRTPGQTNVVHFAVSYGTSGTPCTASPCSIDSVGSQVSSVTRTALGIYSVNFVSPLSKVQCAYGTGYGSGGDSTVPYAMTTCSSSCSSITFQTRQTNSVGTLKDSFGNLLCTGIP
jgi:hypothetical protein